MRKCRSQMERHFPIRQLAEDSQQVNADEATTCTASATGLRGTRSSGSDTRGSPTRPRPRSAPEGRDRKARCTSCCVPTKFKTNGQAAPARLSAMVPEGPHRVEEIDTLVAAHWPKARIRHPWPSQLLVVRTRRRSPVRQCARRDPCGGCRETGIPTAIC